MRRLMRSRERPMARRPEEERGFSIPPGARGIAGWAAVAVLLVGVAFGARLIGTGGEESAVLESESPSQTAQPSSAPIAFGTAIDAVTGEVAPDARTAAFGPGDAFAYSVRPLEPPPTTIYVEVLRTGATPATVQPPSPQGLPEGAAVIAFVVPADALLADFGPGAYVMRIFAVPTEAPIAIGEFSLAGDASPSG